MGELRLWGRIWTTHQRKTSIAPGALLTISPLPPHARLAEPFQGTGVAWALPETLVEPHKKQIGQNVPDLRF